MDIPVERYEELSALITSDESPVGIDAKKTHVLILHLLQDLGERMERIERKLETSPF